MLTPAEEQQIKDGKFTAALVWHEMSEYTNAVNRGAEDEFKRLGITVVGADRRRFRRRPPEVRRRDGSRQETVDHPVAAGRPGDRRLGLRSGPSRPA